jgi:hypothetical protein
MLKLDAQVIALALLQAGLFSAGLQVALPPSGTWCSASARALNDELWAAKLLQTNKKLHAKIQKTVKERYGSVRAAQEVCQEARR